uniref:sensor histidine kinase n=1 Tax=Agathobacter sp. TaxID=2021311 RepID=UPI004056D573
MYAGIGIVIGIVILQTVLIWNYQRQIKDICRQLSFLLKHDSNMMITREFEAGHIGELADLINEMLSQRRQEKKQYLEKEKMISDTYTNLSHDIRTPLTSLDGYVQLLENSTEEKEQERYIAIIQERIDSLKTMLEELFTFAKLKNDSYELELSCCNINRILKEVIFSYYEEWEKRMIVPQIQVTEESLYLMGNKPAIQRVIQNVIKNGLDHGEKKIKIMLEREEQQIVLKICNDVEKPEMLDVEQIFERFYKADGARSKNSTGLGLSIAKEFVIRMNGEITARVEGEEFQMEIRFPCCSLGFL